MTNNPDLPFLQNLIGNIKTIPPPRTISDYVEGHRILPQNTPHPGPWRNEMTPYLVEIMDCLAPSSPVQHIAVMKGAQIGLTTAAENLVGYYADVDPSPIMVMSATDDAIQNWGTLRLDPTLKSLGIDLAPELDGNKKSRKSGDTTSKKEFPGGYIILASARAASKMRSFPIRILVRDEIDGAPIELASGEGNWLSVSEARTNSQEATRKIFDLSTPTTFQQSNIYRQYLKGDQRQFNVPCPHCGELQVLEMGNSKTTHGLKPYWDEGEILHHAYYVCKFCEEHILNHHKTKMLKIASMGGSASWIPTVPAQEKNYRSYHLSSLYSPVGFLSWSGLYQKYRNGKDNLDERRSFVNLYAGLPFQELGERPDVHVISRRIDGSQYLEGQIPNEVVFTTMAADVQTSEKNPRIELEICGHGTGFKTASIMYKVFHGPVDNAYKGAWKDLEEWVKAGGAACKRKDGIELWPLIAGVDSGTATSTIYQFCSTMKGFYPIKGMSWQKVDKKKTIDTENIGRPERYKLKKLDDGQILVGPNTIYYKNHIYNNLKIPRPNDPQEELPNGFCDFPRNRIEKHKDYFDMLTAEEKKTDGTFDAGGRRNESLDVRVYNLCLADYYLAKWLANARAKMKEQGSTQLEIERFGTVEVIKALEARNKPPLTKS